MGIPEIIVIVLFGMRAGSYIVGGILAPKEVPKHISSAFCDVLMIGLLYWGGFFS